MDNEPINGRQFTAYHAGDLAVDLARPWQVISACGALCARLATRDRAAAAVAALEADFAADTLPCNLSRWDKNHLLHDPE